MHPAKNFDFTPYHEIIETVLKTIGLVADECYEADDDYYALTKGSASIYIGFSTNIYESGYIERFVYFSGFLMAVPSSQTEAFYRRLLGEAWQRVGVKFFITDKDEAWAEISRDLEGLDEEEALACLERVAETADELDDILTAEFV